MSKRIIIFLILVCLTLFYFAYDNYKDKKTAQDEIITLTEQIMQLNEDIKKNNQIIAQREQEKAQHAMSIKQLHEQISDALKNNQCADEYMPSNVSDWMRSGKN